MAGIFEWLTPDSELHSEHSGCRSLCLCVTTVGPTVSEEGAGPEWLVVESGSGSLAVRDTVSSSPLRYVTSPRTRRALLSITRLNLYYITSSKLLYLFC